MAMYFRKGVMLSLFCFISSSYLITARQKMAGCLYLTLHHCNVRLACFDLRSSSSLQGIVCKHPLLLLRSSVEYVNTLAEHLHLPPGLGGWWAGEVSPSSCPGCYWFALHSSHSPVGLYKCNSIPWGVPPTFGSNVRLILCFGIRLSFIQEKCTTSNTVSNAIERQFAFY